MSGCPAIDELEHALAAPQATEDVARHLEACPRCRARARRIRANQSILQITSRGDRRELAAALRTDDAPALTPTGGLSGYEILSELHRGGQGVVYRAFQKATKRTVAIKVLLRGAFATSRQRNRFEREIEIAASLRHPNIVSIFESGVDADGSHYLVMNYVDGVALDAWAGTAVGGNPPRSTRGRLELFCKICDAVSYAHQRGIIHRDLKPANILIDAAGEPHVLDFGLAKAVGFEMNASEAGMTRTGEFMGTFSYAAPEQLRGDPDQIDTRTDVYALGVILFQMLTGRFPYPVDGSLSAILRSITEVEPRPPSEFLPSIGDELNTIVIKALSKPRERRYQSAGALRRDIASYLAGEPIDAKRDSRWYMLKKTARRYRAALAISISFFALVVVFGIATAVSARRTARERDRAVIAERRSAENARELAAALAESRIERARSLETTGDFATAEQILWEEFIDPTQGGTDERTLAPPSQANRRRAYWALWELYAASACLRTWRTHDASQSSSALSGDGRIVVAVGADGVIKLWDAATARPTATLAIEPRESLSIMASPMGDALASFDADRKIRVWELTPTRAEPGAVFDAPDVNMYRMEMSPDGKSIAIANAPGSISLRDRRTGELIVAWDAAPAAGSALSYSADGMRLACGSHGGQLAVWDLRGPGVPPMRRWLADSHKARVRDVCFSPDGTVVAAVGGEGDESIKLLDARTGRLTQTLSGHTSHINFASFRGDGKQLVTCSFDRSVRLWDPTISVPLTTFRGHADNVAQVHFVPDTEMIASVAVDRTARLWDARPGGALHRTKLVDETVLSICITSDGNRIYGGASDGIVRRIDAGTAHVDGSWSGHRGAVSAVAISPDGRTVASSGYDGTTRIWDTATGECRHICGDRQAKVSSIAFHPGGRLVASGCDDGVVRLWDVASGQLAGAYEGSQDHPRRPAVAFSPDGKTLATMDSRSHVALWDTASGTLRATLVGHRGQLRCLAFSTDGRLLASAGDDASIRLWDPIAAEPLGSLEGNRDEVFGLAFSPDGTLLASAGRGRQIRLWDMGQRTCLATLSGHTNMIFALTFSPDGWRLYSCAADGTVGLWDLSYYERHIAGNLEYQLSRLPTDRMGSAAALRDWSAWVLARPASRFNWPASDPP